jgi:hypothetical protein
MTSRVKFMNGVSEEATIQVGVNFSCGNTFMAQHLLHCAQVGARFHKVRCKRMTKSMRTNIFGNTCFIGQRFDKQKHRLPAEFASSAVQKNNISAAGLNVHVAAHGIAV